MGHRAIGMAIMLLHLACGCAAHRAVPAAPNPDEAWRTLVGSWEVTSGTRSLVLSIHDNGQALVLFMQTGQHSMKHVSWTPLPGGILIEDVTRLRLWLGRHAGELRAEFEVDPHREHGDRTFPTSFFMGRIGERRLPAERAHRPLPDHWTQPQVGDTWDADAGRR